MCLGLGFEGVPLGLLTRDRYGFLLAFYKVFLKGLRVWVFWGFGVLRPHKKSCFWCPKQVLVGSGRYTWSDHSAGVHRDFS